MNRANPRVLLDLTYLTAREIETQKIWRIYLTDAEYTYFKAALVNLDAWRAFMNLSNERDKNKEMSKSDLSILSKELTDITRASQTAILASFRTRSMIFEQFLPQLWPMEKLCCKLQIDVKNIKLNAETSVFQHDTVMHSNDFNQLKQPNGLKVTEEDDDYDETPKDIKNISMSLPTPNGVEINKDQSFKAVINKPTQDSTSTPNIPLREIYYTLEFDHDAMIEQQTLEESEAQEEMADKTNTLNDKSLSQFGSASLSMKYLLNVIEANRATTSLSDRELRNLLSDVRPHRSKWLQTKANEEKVGQEELYEACEKVLMELKNYTEHSTAFLNKVNKREAPDYFDIIKKPMDLGTVTKKLKAFSYKSKKDFADDLDLIWSNCLQYNTNPQSPYRKHAYAMKKKAEKLLQQVPEVHVRERAEVEAEEEADAESDDGEATAEDQKASRKAPGSSKHLNSDAAQAVTQPEIPHKEDSASLSADALSTNELVLPINGLTATATPNMRSPSKDRDVVMKDSDRIDLEQEEKEVSAEIDADTGDVQFEHWKEITKKTRASICAQREKQSKRPFGEREAIIRTVADMKNFEELERKHGSVLASRELEDDRVMSGHLKHKGRMGINSNAGLYDDDADREGASDETFLPEYVITSGFPEATWLKTADDELKERTFEDDFEERDSVDRPSLSEYMSIQFPNHGISNMMESNVEGLRQIRKIYDKCVAVKNNAPIGPSGLEERGRAILPEKVQVKEDKDLPPLILNAEIVAELFEKVTTKVLAHAGFEGAQPNALHILTEVGAEFMMNLGRSLRIYMDNYHKKMSAEEMVLHTLFENGIKNVGELESYVRDDIERYGAKLHDIKRRLETSYQELLNGPGEGHVIDDETLFADEDTFMMGTFTDDLGEDFFGLRDTGLDQELGIEYLNVPSRLWFGSKKPKIPHLTPQEKLPQYIPPPPFVPVRDPDSQIGLLGEFFKRKLDETNGNLIEDEFIPSKSRSKPRYPPVGKLNAAGAKRKAKEDPNLAKKKQKKKQMEQQAAERAEKKKQKADARAAKQEEKAQRKKEKQEQKERERAAKLEAKREKAQAARKTSVIESVQSVSPPADDGDDIDDASSQMSEEMPQPPEPSPPHSDANVIETPKKKKKKKEKSGKFSNEDD